MRVDVHASPARPEAYRSWRIGELGLVGLLGASTLYFALHSSLDGYPLPEARLALDTAVAVCATIVAILTSVRFLVEGRVRDVLLACGFLAAGLGTLTFAAFPTLGGDPLGPVGLWAVVAIQILAAALVAVAPFVDRRVGSRPRVLVAMGTATVLAVVGVVALVVAIGPTREIKP